MVEKVDVDDDDDDDDDAGLREREAEISRCRTAGCRWLRHSGFKIKECSTCAGDDDDAAAGCDTSSSTLEIKECPTCGDRGDDDHDDDDGDCNTFLGWTTLEMKAMNVFMKLVFSFVSWPPTRKLYNATLCVGRK